MPTEEAKQVAAGAEKGDVKTRTEASKGKQTVVESDDDGPDDEADTGGAAAGSPGTKKRRSKKKKGKDAESGAKRAVSGLTDQQIKQLLTLNPALAQELGVDTSGESGAGSRDPADAMRKLSLQDIMTGLAASGKNVKDMGAYKFWQTQPVPKFGETSEQEEGPLKIQDINDVPTTPPPLLGGFDWVTMDVMDEAEMKEIWELLAGHYVEDDEALFRFNYSMPLLRWALMSPGWKKEWHVGVRASASKKLVAFISAVPVKVRVRNNSFLASEVNFLCVHKKLRGKRLAPVLIKEVTRRSNLNQIWQGLYTAGVVLPTPVSTCRYFHRAINWQKLHDVGFSPLPANSKPQYQVRKYALPDNTLTKGLREMEAKDINSALDLFTRYMARYDMAPEFCKEEFEHWFVRKNGTEEQVIWSYVVEGEDKRITDFFSFYCLESSVINSVKHQNVRAAYLFYYATETALVTPPDRAALQKRLNALMNDALILAKRFKFDVFNALSLMDNALFLEQQKFGPGDGQLHYYLFNYRANPIGGGVKKDNCLDENNLSGLGLVMF